MRQLALLVGAAVNAAAVQGQTGPSVPPAAEQIAAAVLPMPEEFRAGARVYGYASDGRFVILREGKGMHCLAQYPKEERFHVSCYHESLEPFMGRGRELRAAGTTNPATIDSIRYAEVAAGRLKVPSAPAALYQIFGTGYEPATTTVAGPRRLYVVYVPFATGASTGLPEKPRGNDPWLMSAGTAKAHIMFTPTM